MEDSMAVFTVREKRIMERIRAGSTRKLRIFSGCILLILIILLSYFGLKANEAIEQIIILKSRDLSALVNFHPETKNEIFLKQALLKSKLGSLVLARDLVVNSMTWHIFSGQVGLVFLLLINVSHIPFERIIHKFRFP